MKSFVRKLFMVCFACLTILLLTNTKTYADNANVSVSTAGGSVGDSIAINVVVTPDVDATANIWLSYDTNFLEYVSGGNSGVAGIVNGKLDEIKANENGTLTFNFKLKAVGSTIVNIASNSEVKNKQDSGSLNISTTNGTVHIEGNSEASNDSTLSGMVVQAISSNGDRTNVTYSPAFSPDVHEYRAELSGDTTNIVVSTTLSDANARTQVSGTKIDKGDNKTTITVKAQDGTETQYILYCTRSSETTTATDNGAAPVVGEQETTDINRAPKQIDSIGLYLIQDFSLVTIPEGFAEGVAMMDGKEIAVLKGTSKDLTLVCLSSDIQGTDARLCIYTEASGAIDAMVNITSKQKIYTVIPTDASYVGPEGYTETTLYLNGDNVKAWKKSEDSEFYVVYAMNPEGEKALYVYDTKEETMQRFVEGNKSENVEDLPAEHSEEYLRLKKNYDDMAKEYKNDHSKKNTMIVILTLVILLMVICMILRYRKKKTVNADDREKTDASSEENNSSDEQNNERIDERKNEEAAVEEPETFDDSFEEVSEDRDAEQKELKEESKEELKAKNKKKNKKKKKAKTAEIATEQPKEVNEAKEDIKEIPEEAKEERNEEVKEKVKETPETEDETFLIDLEADEPFEIEFVDLEDNK